MSDLNPYEEGLAIDLATAESRIEELEAKLKWADEISNIQAARLEEAEKERVASQANADDMYRRYMGAADRSKEAVETLRKGFKSCDPTKTAAAIILAIAQLEGHGE